MFNKCSIDLMALIVKEDLKKVCLEIETIKADIKQTGDITKFDDTMEAVNELKRELEETLMAKRLDKFKQDEDDYKNKRVYIWQNKNPTHRRMFANKRHASPTITSDSEYTSDASVNSQDFWGQKMGRSGTRRRRQDGA